MSLDKQQMVLFAFLIGVVTALFINILGDVVGVIFWGEMDFYSVKRQILGLDLFVFVAASVLSLWYFLHKDKIKRNARK